MGEEVEFEESDKEPNWFVTEFKRVTLGLAVLLALAGFLFLGAALVKFLAVLAGMAPGSLVAGVVICVMVLGLAYAIGTELIDDF